MCIKRGKTFLHRFTSRKSDAIRAQSIIGNNMLQNRSKVGWLENDVLT